MMKLTILRKIISWQYSLRSNITTFIPATITEFFQTAFSGRRLVCVCEVPFFSPCSVASFSIHNLQFRREYLFSNEERGERTVKEEKKPFSCGDSSCRITPSWHSSSQKSKCAFMFNARFFFLARRHSVECLFYILERKIETFYEKGLRKLSTCVIADGLKASLTF